MPKPPFLLAPGAELFYVPGPRAKRPVQLALLPDEPLPARVHFVHGDALVDLIVTVPVAEGAEPQPDVYVRFVPLLMDGQPDPLSPMGRCHVGREHVGRDYTAMNEIAEGLRRFPGETDDSWQERQQLRAAMVASGKMPEAPGEDTP